MFNTEQLTRFGKGLDIPLNQQARHLAWEVLIQRDVLELRNIELRHLRHWEATLTQTIENTKTQFRKDLIQTGFGFFCLGVFATHVLFFFLGAELP